MISHMDLHTHSSMSDGTCSPSELVQAAKEAGLSMVALTDHDTLAGLDEALAAGRELGVCVLPSIEMGCESPFELHILGLDIDPHHHGLNHALQEVQQRRKKRNELILHKLASMGGEVSDQEILKSGNVTRLHIALAMQGAGFVKDTAEAFRRYLSPGMPAYAKTQRMMPCEVIERILDAGGVPVLAHPCHIKANVHELVKKLSECGLAGIEAYYPDSTDGQTALYISLARQYGLMITCGSDFHGTNRPDRRLGSTWRDDENLERTYEYLLSHHKNASL